VAKRSITPKTHIIKAIRARSGATLYGALHEFCDNSIGHGAAATIYITIDRERIVVRDDGWGADDVIRLFTLGDASDFGNLSNIGQYGVGATDSAIFLGDELEVITVRARRVQRAIANWSLVDQSGEWTIDDERLSFSSAALSSEFPLAQGTKVSISKLHRRWAAQSSAKLAEHLGLVFMPALRSGTRIHVTHMDTGGVKFNEWLAPFTPPPLRHETHISGSIDTRHGTIAWSGRAGLSSELTSKQNGVLVIFGPRVIEKTEDPFQGAAVPTLYAEVELHQEDGAKYLLSDKKDRIVKYRDQLMESIRAALIDLIELAREEGAHLALSSITVPLQVKLTRALQGSGILVVDPDEPGEHEEGQGGRSAGGTKPISEEGVPAKPKPPTGVTITWHPLDKLNYLPYDTKISRHSIEVQLAREYYEDIVGYPPKLRDQKVVELTVAIIARGIEVRYMNGDHDVTAPLKPKLRAKIESWGEENEIAPRLQVELQARLARQEAAP
jgi:Histidine kinase-, DNA gyrase B-, and HSP90-like ATPase